MSYSLMKTNNKVANSLIELYKQHGDTNYIGEKITQIEHALQAAYLASQESPHDPEFILAALFHDIGHIAPAYYKIQMINLGVARHESVGANYLHNFGFPERICSLIKMHVDAKRYLITTRPDYFSSLSDASQGTLKHQGGPMTADEITDFENNKYHKDALRLRYIDDYAKKTVWELDCVIPEIETYHNLICSVLGA